MSMPRQAKAGDQLRLFTLDGERVACPIDLKVFPVEVVVRAAYGLLDRAWIFLHHGEDGLVVVLRPKTSGEDLGTLVGDLANALIDAKFRVDLAIATRGVHEQIVQEAFSPVRGRS